MTPEEIEQMKADMEAGTPGDWVAALERGCHGVIAQALPDVGANFVAVVGNDTSTPRQEPVRFANARRIARVPQLEAEVLRLREALEGVMVGGNHLVALLPDDVLPPETAPLDALQIMGAGPEYDAWCCWRSIMLARATLNDGGDNAA